MFKKVFFLVFVICFFSPGCTFTKKEDEKKLFTNISKVKTAEKWQWKVKDGRIDLPLKKGGIDIDFQFEQVDLKQVVSLLMGLIKENYVVVDELQGVVDAEIKGKFKRDEVVRMVRTILNSKNFDLIKNGAVYGIYNRGNLEDAETLLKTDLDENVYLYHLQYASSVNLKSLLNDIYPDISITQNQNLNLLIIKSNKDEYRKTIEVIHKFDKRPKQVLVEFTIMEVTLTNALKYGVEYFFKVNNERGGNISLLPDGVISGSAAVVGKGLKTFGFRNDLKSFITVLKTEGNVDIVSKPHVLVQDGKTSVIKIGREEPIRRGTSVSENGLRSEDILYKDVGVILSVGVEVEENNVVKLHLNQEVSDIIPPTQDPLIDSPSFTTNTIQLDTLLNDGQSIYIGGLMETAEIETVRKVPYLSDIPYLGKIFRSKNFIKTKTELILLLSVEILFDEKDFENQKLKFVRNK